MGYSLGRFIYLEWKKANPEGSVGISHRAGLAESLLGWDRMGVWRGRTGQKVYINNGGSEHEQPLESSCKEC